MDCLHAQKYYSLSLFLVVSTWKTNVWYFDIEGSSHIHFTEKSNKLLKCCFKYVAGHLELGCHGNVNLETDISLFVALVDPKGIILNLYELLRCTFDESR